MITKPCIRSQPRIGTTTTLVGVAAAAVLTVSACSPGSPSTTNPATTSPTSSAAAPAAPATHHPHALRGTISAENGTTWTVDTAKGATYTVNIAPNTTFGTKKAPATAQNFPVGTQVRVMGQRSGTTINATRITAPAPGHTRAPSRPSTAPTPTS
jgi:hypothetical protein